MSVKIKRLFFSLGVISIFAIFASCKDLGCSGSSLRNYDVSDRIEKINKEVNLLEKGEKNKENTERLGDLNEQLATIYLEKEDQDTAFFHVNKAFAYGRNNPYLNYITGLIYGNRGARSGSPEEINRAEQYYRRAVDLKSNYDEAWYALAILLFFYKNEREEPIKILETLYKRSPAYYQARFALGRVYYESGRKQDALDVYVTLQNDLNKLPDSEIIKEFRKNCADNIQRIRTEI